MGQSQINFDNKSIFHKLYEPLNLALFTPILILVDCSVLNLCNRLLTVSFKKHFLHILCEFGVVSEKTADEVVSEELVKVNHLNQVYVQVQGRRRGATSYPILLRLLGIVLEGETQSELVCDVRAFF